MLSLVKVVSKLDFNVTIMLRMKLNGACFGRNNKY